ncbi:membrane protein [Streptomyces viridochromogenes]|uniref:Membrane protein n=1 Tax=Streptomyces viridochromogenes TaxID=1938 RepID=A0A0J7ZLV7_STRVR|nr:membrane protein [Streptomyces viridochromogenes]KMS76981.1 membrane protein [Streptomyces viridochromogenes]
MTHPLALSLPYGIERVHLIAATGVLALVLAGWSFWRNRTRAGGPRASTPAVWVSALAALNCTIYSADTSWRFAADYLDMAGTVERAMMFSAAELALFATALMARQNLKTQGAPGLPGGLVWVITGVQIIPAYAESGAVGGTVRAFVGPVMAAVLWHLAMGIELRLHKPDAGSHGILATLGREVRERLLSRLGVATRNRDAAQITKDRATQRAVALASRLAGMSEEQRKNRRGRWIARRLQTALTRSGVGTDLQQRRALMEQLAARRHATALATVALPSPWIQPAQDLDADRGDRSPLAPSVVTRRADEKQASPWLSAVPGDGPRSTASIGDRQDGDHTEPGTGHEPGGDRPHSGSAGNGDRADEPASSLLGEGEEAAVGDQDAAPAGTEAGGDGPSSSADIVHEAAAQEGEVPSPASVPAGNGGREHPDTETGTEPDRDRPHTVPNDDGDREHPDTETGTEADGDRPHAVPVRRKPKVKASRTRPRGGQSKRSRKQPKLTVEEMVERVRPHVPALLKRDGNESLTRVQLREILRAQNIQGGRNERLTPVLQRLRDEAGATTTRSTTR